MRAWLVVVLGIFFTQPGYAQEDKDRQVRPQENWGVKPQENWGDQSAKASSKEQPVEHEVILDGTRYPESVEHLEAAWRRGLPDTLTWDPDGAGKRRKEALKGAPRREGKDRDEYPPASTKEGGQGASVRHVEPSDNRGAGASMGKQMDGKPRGTKFKIRVKK